MTDSSKTEAKKKKLETKKTWNEEYSDINVFLLHLIGAVVRLWLIYSKYQETIQNHIEVSTPLNSWKRIKEGLYLQSLNISPYEGDLIHETPIMLCFYKFVIEAGGNVVAMIFILFDVWTARCLHATAKECMFQLYVKQLMNKKKYAKDSKDYWLTGEQMSMAPVLIVALYHFSPYTLFNCVGCSTTVFHNFLVALFLYTMLTGNVIVSSLALALSTSISLYTVVLICPLYLHNLNVLKSKCKANFSAGLFIAYLALIFLINTYLDPTLTFIENVYGFILTVPDLQPNIGLFWYFFIEMFDHFRSLFLVSFQINVLLLYTIPLSLKYRKEPFLLTYGLLTLISIFKSYPSVGDIGFTLSLLPCFIHLYPFWQQGFVIGVAFLITSVLGPIVWHLWIYSHSANANFYFGVTLAFATAQIFLITDTLFAYIKREYNLWYGKERKIDGKEARLALD